jgi:hypothetical protein
VLIDVFEGIVRGIVLLPDTVLTKICIVSSDSELDELMLLMLDERRIVAVAERQVRVGVVCVCGCGCGERVR